MSDKLSLLHNRLFWLTVCCLTQLCGYAAPATANYFCDFENDAENSEWVTWVGTRHSTWKTGTAAFYTGQKGLYITDSGREGDNTYSSLKSGGYTVSAYRKMTLEAGTHTISLDYRCPSELISVSLIPADTLTATTIQTATGADYAQIVKNAIVPGLKDLKSSEWIHASANYLVSTAGTYLLAVTYRTSTGAEQPFGAAVDNVEVVKAQADQTACDYQLTDLRLDLQNGVAVLTWKGNADEYEVRYFDSDGRTVTLARVTDTGAVDSCYISLENMTDGTYSFMVRGLGCGGNNAYTGWTYIRHKLIYDPAAHCIDYLNFDARGVVCKYGAFSGTSTTDRITSTTVGYTDYGSDSQFNTHTIHFKPNERDYMTNNLLRTVPEGAFASVRLGSREPNNQSPGSQWQSVSYTIHVTEDIGVVLFRYAYIGQTGGHDRLEQSHIRLRLTDQTGTVINGEECGSVLFTSPTNDAEMNAANANPRTAGWHKGRQDNGEGSICTDYVYWRDWTTVGINVQNYLDQDIKIEVTNYGCNASCHYGYCYFVLDCSKGEILGQTCGEKPRELVVDEGFDYRWYTPFNPNHQFGPDQDPSSRTLDNIAINDTNTYYCDLMRKGNNDCYFTLHAPAIKRLPRANVEVKHQPRDCQNYIVLENKSAVYGFFTNEAGQEDSVARDDEFLRQSVVWTSLSGLNGQLNATASDTILFPNEGDQVTLTMLVEMKEGCSDERTIQFDVPAIGPTIGRDTIRFALGESVEYHGHTYTEPGDETLPMRNAAGCDSSLYLHLDRLDPVTNHFYDTICRAPGQVLEDETREVIRSKSLKYQGSNQYADSVYQVTHHTILDELVTHVDPVGRICADDDSMYIYVHTNLRSVVYDVLFDTKGHEAGFEDILNMPVTDLAYIAIPLPDSITPDYYKVVLLVQANECGATFDSIPFGVSYPSSIAPQKWGNVLALLDTQNNGGYEFAGIQWYCNGLPIGDANQPIFYLGEGQRFNPNDEYTVGLIRAGESVEIMSCPLGDMATDLDRAESTGELPLTFNGQMTLYDVLGREVMRSPYSYSALMQWLQRHGATAIYLVRLTSADSDRTYRVFTR